MLHYEEKKVDPKKNILYGSTQKEEFILFSSSEDEEYPLRVEMVGITHPDREYFIQREHSDYFVLEYVASGKGYIFDGGKNTRWRKIASMFFNRARNINTGRIRRSLTKKSGSIFSATS